MSRPEASRAGQSPGLNPCRAALRPGSGTAALCPWDGGTWGGVGGDMRVTSSKAQPRASKTRHYPDSTSKSIIDKSQLAYSGGAALREAQGLVFHLKGKEGKRSVSESTAGGTAALGKAWTSSPHSAASRAPRGRVPSHGAACQGWTTQRGQRDCC